MVVDVKKTGLRVRVLGPIEVDRDGSGVGLGSPKQRAVLAILLAEPRGSVGRDRIIEGVWGEEASEANRHSFHTYLSNLRALLGDVIVRAGDTYRLEIPAEEVDARRFEEKVAEARRLMATDPGGAAVSLREALGWWRGLPYADLSDVPGLQAEIRRLEELRLEAVELRVDAELASGAHGTLIAELEALAEEHPLRERFRAQHMLALYRSGRQSEALRAYRRTEAFLAGELGVEPSRALQDLELKILDHDESLLDAADRTVTQRLAFLVTDIEGSTSLWDTHPQGMADALAVHDRVLREAIESVGGRLFKHTGDGVLAVFPDSLSAVAAAEAAQRALGSADWGEVEELRVRMGIDVGEAEARGGDFYGPPLNRASRISAAGHGGQVLVSASVQAEITAAAPAGVQLRQLGEHRLKGLASPERIAQLVFVGLPAEFPELRLDADAVIDERVELTALPGYELRERIGEGAFGVVYRAYQPSVGREVAIKVIRPELADHPSFVRRFEAEARTIARLAHPHIVPLIDFWRDPDGAYLVLQLLPGGSLMGALAAGMDREAARRVLGHVGAALDHAHSQGMVHGDLKPANVMLDGSGNAYLSDFGIVTRLLDPELALSLSSAPEFRAPEEAETGPSPAGDRYALGVMAGRLFEGTAEVEPVLARATASNPEDRYRSAAEFLADLDQALGEAPAEPERPAVSRNPYKGLRAFDEADAADFHGREELVATLLAAVSEHRFVTVVGPSGSGKSSVVRAGLLPALARGAVDGSQDWFRIEMTPGPDPMAALSEAVEAVASGPVDHAQLMEVGLRGLVDGEMLVVVDQFEELFTQVESPEQRRMFIDLIAGAVEDGRGRVRVVATLRADLYDRPLEDERLGRLVRDGLVTVLPPTREELVEMITAPAQAVGLRFEPGLSHHIAEDVAHQPGGLPLLQYALTELVERRGGDLLTANDYINVGGVAGALATRAEAVYQNLTPSQQEAARQILLRLVTVHEDTDDTRRRVRRSELESVGIPHADLDTVLDKFIGDRLLLADRDPTTRGPTVEVAHEALLREWPRLAGWIDDQRESLILGRRFRAALADWEANDRHHDHLLTGHRLAPFTGWAETTTLTGEEQEYYQASQSKDQAEQLARRRRRRTLTGILAAAAVVATILGGVAAVQAQRANTEAETARLAEAEAEREAERATAEAERAEREAERAREEANRARSRELTASALNALGTDPSLAKLLAVAAADLAEATVDTMSVLHSVWTADRILNGYVWPEQHVVAGLSTALHPDGDRVVAGGTEWGPGGHLEVARLSDGEALWSFEAEGEGLLIDRPRFTADGSRVVAGLIWDPDETQGAHEPSRHSVGVRIWDAETGETMADFDLGRCGAWLLGVSPTHLLVGTLGDDAPACFASLRAGEIELEVALELLDLATGQRTVLTPVFWGGEAVSEDGRYVAFTEGSGPEPATVVVEVDTGRRVLEFNPFTHEGISDGWARELNHDGSLLIAGDRPMAVWDVDAGEIIATFDGHAGAAWDAEFAPGGDTVYSIGQSAVLHHWDARTGLEIASYPAVGAGSLSLADGVVLVTDTATRTAALVDVSLRGEVWALPTCGGFVIAHTLSVSRGHAVLSEVCPEGATSYVIDIEARTVDYTIPGQGAQDLTISPDGSLFVRQDGDWSPPDDWIGTISVRDLGTGDVLVELDGLCTYNQASAVDNHLQEGCVAYPERPFPFWNWFLEWSPDSRLVAAKGNPHLYGIVVVWDAQTGEMVHTHARCAGHDGEHLIFSTDSSELIVFCDRRFIAFETETWEEVRSWPPDEPEGNFDVVDLIFLIGYTPDGSSLVGMGRSAEAGFAMFWISPTTLEVTTVIPQAFDGTPKSWAVSPDGTLAATGDAAGFVKVWDLETREVVHEIYVGPTQVQGVAFVGDHHLAVAPQEGNLYVYTIDPDELLNLVRGSLHRGFTPAECQKYGFGDECPTLADLRAR